MPNKAIHDVETGEVTVKPMTKAEVAELEAIRAAADAKEAKEAADKESAQQKIAALGLTLDELKALLAS